MPGLEISDPSAYIDGIVGRLGDRDPFDVLTSTPDAIDAVVRGHDADVLRSRPFEGKWTPLEIIGHYVDVEVTFGWRVRHSLCDAEPVIQGFDQDRWVTRLGHNGGDPQHFARTFRLLRDENVAVWRLCSPEDLQRTVQHTERGAEPIGLWLRLLAGHDLHHLDQIDRYLAAVTG